MKAFVISKAWQQDNKAEYDEAMARWGERLLALSLEPTGRLGGINHSIERTPMDLKQRPMDSGPLMPADASAAPAPLPIQSRLEGLAAGQSRTSDLINDLRVKMAPYLNDTSPETAPPMLNQIDMPPANSALSNQIDSHIDITLQQIGSIEELILRLEV